jgi:hypothetical protein
LAAGGVHYEATEKGNPNVRAGAVGEMNFTLEDFKA